jgi:hypothetical protein
VPEDALRSVVFGCRAAPEFIQQARSFLERATLRHVELRMAVLDDHAFDLNYASAS